MEILTKKYLGEYKKKFGKKLKESFNNIKSGVTENNFEYYIESSAVFSSNIEGNTIDLNSFMNAKLLNRKLKGKEISEILDLKDAYNFAKSNTLNEHNFLKMHKTISDKLLIKSKQGKYREGKIGVFDKSGLVYLAIEAENVKGEMKKLFNDIEYLCEKNLLLEEVFYYASLIHLRLAHIHPFMDGNGRAARLLEKWFMSSKLDEAVWKINSEKYYFENRNNHYLNLNLGPDYYELNYDKCFPFLEMLANAIIEN